MKRDYAVRIAVYTKGNGNECVCVTFNDDAHLALLDFGRYFTIKRMNDRLAFVGWKNKTGRGMAHLNNNMLQFSVPSDIEIAKEFAGQYNVMRSANDKMMFVSLEDRKDFAVTLPQVNGRKMDETLSAKPTEQTATTSLTEMLQTAINACETELKDLERKIDEAKEVYNNLIRELKAKDEETKAYRNALYAARGKEQ